MKYTVSVRLTLSQREKMTDIQEEIKQEEVDYKTEFEKLKADFEKIKPEYDSLLSHKAQLLKEKKNETEKRREAEQQILLEKARKDGDYELLLKSAEEQQKEWQAKYAELDNKIKQKEARNLAMKMAGDLDPLDGDAAEVLADYIEKRIRYDDNGLVILDAKGNPSVMGVDALKEEFKNSNKFKPLIVGSKATGGGATGNTANGVGSVKEISRIDFESMPHSKRMEFFKSGGKLKD